MTIFNIFGDKIPKPAVPPPLVPMTVRDLIELLSKHDPNLPVAYKCMSEQVLLEPDDIEVVNLVLPRNDGWIQNWRKDMDTQDYLLLPGH